MKTESIGIVGLGLVGRALGARLAAAGWALLGWDRDEGARSAWAAQGGSLAASPAEALLAGAGLAVLTAIVLHRALAGSARDLKSDNLGSGI